MTEDWRNIIDKREAVGALAVDLSKAFKRWTVFEEGPQKSEYPEKNLSEHKKRVNNKLNPHMVLTLGFEPGPH